MRSVILLACLAMFVSACQRYDDRHHAVGDVRWSLDPDMPGQEPIALRMESKLAPDSGYQVPNASQAKNGALHVSFKLYHSRGQRFRYMVYYRNETYKFPEATESGDQRPLAEENFYGGWTDGFHLSGSVPEDGLAVRERVTISSDPRNEFPDARWSRDPRTGKYSLLVVAIAEDDFDKSPPPAAIQDVRLKVDGHFIEPYWYWLHGPGHERPDAAVTLLDHVLTLSVEMEPALGVHGCSADRSDFEPFIHHLDTTARFDNVPVVADVLGNKYTPVEYDSVLCFTPHGKFVSTTPQVSSTPCANIRVDTAQHCLEMWNPASTGNSPRKEQVGVRSRHAFTYGRYRVHARLSPLLNDSDLWNGLTNAVWLIGTGGPGPLRRNCDGGYLSYASDGGQTRRIDRTSYAEIDFEIMKGVPLCPERSFPPIYPQQVADANDRSTWLRKLPLEVAQQRGKVTVACTNWDLACPDPPRFSSGCQDLVLDDRVFTSHRWDRDYRAVIQKSMEADDELFGPDGYWFEIDWRPEEIFWRIGPSPENMRTVGYMNSSMTSIPNVPMWLVVSQEFHNTTWWPGSPYEQGGIPFPEKDLVGRIFEARVE